MNGNLIKIKTKVSKDTIQKIKGQVTEREKICVNHLPDKGLVYPEYINNSYYSKFRKMNNSNEKWAKDLNKYF